jgi:alanyl-tRNA synthetase
MDSFRHLSTERALLAGLASSLKVPSSEVPGRVEQLVTRLRDAEREVARLRADQARAAAADLVESAERVGEVDIVGGRVADGLEPKELRELAADLRNRARADKTVVVLFSATTIDGATKVPFVVATTAGARDAGIAAGAVVKEVSALVAGRGGGKPDLAQGAGTDPAGIPAAMARVAQLVEGD